MNIKHKWGILIVGIVILTLSGYYFFGNLSNTFNFATTFVNWDGDDHSYISIQVDQPSDVWISMFTQETEGKVHYTLRKGDEVVMETHDLGNLEKLNKTYQFEPGRYSIVLESDSRAQIRFNAYGGYNKVKFAISNYDGDE